MTRKYIDFRHYLRYMGDDKYYYDQEGLAKAMVARGDSKTEIAALINVLHDEIWDCLKSANQRCDAVINGDKNAVPVANAEALKSGDITVPTNEKQRQGLIDSPEARVADIFDSFLTVLEDDEFTSEYRRKLNRRLKWIISEGYLNCRSFLDDISSLIGDSPSTGGV